MKLQSKILVPVIIFLTIGMITISVILFGLANAEITKTVTSEIELVASELKTILDEYIRDEKSNIAIYSTQPVFSALGSGSWTPQSANAEIDRIAQYKVEYETIGLADLDGNLVACNDRASVGNINISTRDYFKASLSGKTASSNVLLSKVSGNPVIVFSSPVIHDCEICGVFFASVDISGFNNTYVDSIKIGSSGYAYMSEASGVVTAHPDKSMIGNTNLNDFSFGAEMLALKNGLYLYEYKGVQKTVSFRTAEENGWMVAVTADDDDIYAGINRMKELTIIILIAALVLCSLIIILIIRSIVKPIKEAVKITETIASGDLTVAIEEKFLRSKDETGELAAALDKMIEKLREIVIEVRKASETVSVGSGQLASTAETISQGATEQASTAEEVSSSMEEIGASIKQNTENSTETASTADKNAQNAAAGAEAVNEAVASMKIIAEKITLIEELARSTNLLSLNASIEAARAGEAGRGFSVVASEVGKLAEASRKAAADISELSDASMRKADIAGQMISDIVPDIQKTAELVAEISAASSEQNTAARQVNLVMGQLDQVIQANAASAEEATSMSEELSSQAEALLSLIDYFNIGENSARCLKTEEKTAVYSGELLDFNPEPA